MKSYTSFSMAILVALSLYPPWAGVHAQANDTQTDTDTQANADAQTNTDADANNNEADNNEAQSSTNLYRARIGLVCTTTNANGNLVHDRITTAQFVRDSARSVGATNFRALALAYNRNNNSLEVVDRNTREVISTPLTFGSGNALANSNGTRVVLHHFVFLNSDAVASGFLSATQRLAFRRNGELRSFGMRGSIFYSFTDDTNSTTICSGNIFVGSLVPQGGNSRDLEDDNDRANQANQVNQVNNQRNRNNRNNVSTNNVNRGFGTTNVNQGGFGRTNINTGFGTTNLQGAVGTDVNRTLAANQGFGTGVNQGLTANQGFGTGITGVNPDFGTGIAGINPNFGTGITSINQGVGGTGVTQ